MGDRGRGFDGGGGGAATQEEAPSTAAQQEAWSGRGYLHSMQIQFSS